MSASVAEEQIDLEEVNGKLLDVEKRIKEATDKHNEYLKELGLPSIS